MAGRDILAYFLFLSASRVIALLHPVPRVNMWAGALRNKSHRTACECTVKCVSCVVVWIRQRCPFPCSCIYHIFSIIYLILFPNARAVSWLFYCTATLQPTGNSQTVSFISSCHTKKWFLNSHPRPHEERSMSKISDFWCGASPRTDSPTSQEKTGNDKRARQSGGDRKETAVQGLRTPIYNSEEV